MEIRWELVFCDKSENAATVGVTTSRWGHQGKLETGNIKIQERPLLKVQAEPWNNQAYGRYNRLGKNQPMQKILHVTDDRNREVYVLEIFGVQKIWSEFQMLDTVVLTLLDFGFALSWLLLFPFLFFFNNKVYNMLCIFTLN